MAAIRSFVWFVLAWLPLQAAPEFVGMLTAPGVALFALADPGGARATRWLRLGQQFEGYTIIAYDPADETLIIKNRQDIASLRLRVAKIINSRAQPDEMLRVAAQEVTRNERWTDPIRYEGPHLFKGNWLIAAHHDVSGRIETRIIVFTPSGIVQDYLRP